MDVRTHGKGFDAARKRAIEEGNFRVIYARPPRVEDVFGDGLLLTWATAILNFNIIKLITV